MTAEETAKRIKKSQTDGERMITFDPEARPGVSGLLSTAAICTGRSEVEIAEEIGMGGAGALKKYVTESVNEHFAPIRARRKELVQDMDYVKDVLHEATAALTRSPRPRSPRYAKPWEWCTKPSGSRKRAATREWAIFTCPRLRHSQGLTRWAIISPPRFLRCMGDCMYRLVASDMDETFLDADHAIPASNLRALKRMRELGVLFVLRAGDGIPLSWTTSRGRPAS